MWTIIVEVQLPDGAGTIFRVGEWRHDYDAYRFARELELKLGESKVTANVCYSSEYLKRWSDKMWWITKKVKVNPARRMANTQFPACEYDDEEEQQ